MKTFIVLFVLLGLAFAGNTCESKTTLAACANELKAVGAAIKRGDLNLKADMAKNIASNDFAACKAAYSGC